ncbi:MAG TPA: PP2C family protein-serine/threonine phosphatase [Terriglobia bacterium]|nr:PP2C family protein-serine/threonine phosphatase [Terriglobia bacterium]
MTADPNSRLACFELWGGNRKAELPVELPGLSGWISSCPLDPEAGGGDVHYLSVCRQGKVSRIALADVSGHGPSANAVAESLREKLRAHTDNWDQSVLMRELSDAFHEGQTHGRFATAAVFGFYVETSELLFTNAGHLPALWYRARECGWDCLQETTRYAREVQDLPLGLIQGTNYSQTAVRLEPNDLLTLYTDGITETRNAAGQELGLQGLLDMARRAPVETPTEFGQALLTMVRDFRGRAARRDDETVVVLKRLLS